MAIANRPANAVLNPAWPQHANVADWHHFADGAGNTATAGVGRNLTLGGVDATAFQWLSALGGGALEVLQTGGTVRFPQQTGGDAAERTAGSLLAIVRCNSTTGNRFWYHNGGSTSAVGHLRSRLAIAGGDNPNFTHVDSIGSAVGQGNDLVATNDWLPVILTWSVAAGRMELHYLDASGVARTFSRATAPLNGVIIKDTTYEALITNATAGIVGMSIAQFVRLTAVMSSGEIAAWLADPWSHLMVPAFTTDKPWRFDPTETTMKVAMVTNVENAGQVSMRVKWYSDAGRTALVATSNTATATAGGVEELLICTATGLTAGTTYYPVLEYDIDASGNWTAHAPVTADCEYTTMPSLAGTLKITADFDPHHDANMADAEDDTTERQVNANAVIAAFAPHIAILGGDQFREAYASDAGVTLLGQLYRGMMEPVTDIAAMLPVVGNHDKIDGLGGAADLAYTAMRGKYLPGRTADDANGRYGVIDNAICRIVWAEPYTSSGLMDPDDADAIAGGSLSPVQLAFVRNQIRTNTRPWLLVVIHNGLVAGGATGLPYMRVGAGLLLQAGTQEKLIHDDIEYSLQRNPAAIGAVRERGHDHWVEIYQAGRTLHVEVPSSATQFSASNQELVDRGTWVDTGGTLPSGVTYSGLIYGVLTLSLTATGGTINLVRTTAAGGDGVTAATTVEQSLTFESSGVALVEVRVKHGAGAFGDWTAATYDDETGRWSLAGLELELGANTIQVRSTDVATNVSEVQEITITRVSNLSGASGRMRSSSTGVALLRSARGRNRLRIG